MFHVIPIQEQLNQLVTLRDDEEIYFAKFIPCSGTSDANQFEHSPLILRLNGVTNSTAPTDKCKRSGCAFEQVNHHTRTCDHIVRDR